MTERRPRVSVGLPVYNGEAYLAQAIEAVRAQTLVDWELVISDNGSTDRTAEICSHYAAQDARVRLERQENNRGAAWNFNRVFELSRGELFKWAAHDDLCAPDFLARCVAVLDADPSVVWCHSRFVTIDPAGSIVEGPFGRWYDACIAAGRDPDRDDDWGPADRSAARRYRAILLGGTWGVDAFGVMRSEALRRTRLLLPVYGAEKILLCELALQGRYRELPAPLFQMRVHEAGSGALGTAAAQQAYVAPGAGSPRSARLRLLRAFATAIARHPLPLAERAACTGALAAYVLQVRKWPQAARQILRGAGVGGSYRPLLERLRSQGKQA
ncbi:MAG: glycosyltransferase family 2 protein [Pirellulales bacterium]